MPVDSDRVVVGRIVRLYRPRAVPLTIFPVPGLRPGWRRAAGMFYALLFDRRLRRIIPLLTCVVALQICDLVPSTCEAFNNWGAALAAQAKTLAGEAAAALFREAGENTPARSRSSPTCTRRSTTGVPR